MEQALNEIPINATDQRINDLVAGIRPGDAAYSKHFSQNEEFFLRLKSGFFVPSFPIHHDVSQKHPSKEYVEKLHGVLTQVAKAAGEVVAGLTFFFDPRDTLRPAFFRLYRYQGTYYLYLLRIDLRYRPQEHRVVARGSNDITPEYETRDLYVDAGFLPLDQVLVHQEHIHGFIVKQIISQTWIGETGRGYFVQGIWMDHDLTKFFTKLFVPKDVRIYPHYPFMCRFKTVFNQTIRLDQDHRKTMLPYLHRAVSFLAPRIPEIQRVLRHASFSEDLPLFQKMKSAVPESWGTLWKHFSMRAYLNDREQREFFVEP